MSHTTYCQCPSCRERASNIVATITSLTVAVVLAITAWCIARAAIEALLN